jgi:hypothetical protein
MEEAIIALESKYSTTILHKADCAIPPHERQAVKSQKRIEREVRFIHRVATLIGPRGRTAEIYSPGKQKRMHTEAAELLDRAHKAVRRVLSDEYFRESLTQTAHLRLLLQIQEDLPNAALLVRGPQPKYPSQRNREENNARTRQLVDRLADACFRIYGYCDETIITHLTSYPWLEYVAAGPQFRALIKLTQDRKIDRFQRRTPNEDYLHAGLVGEWSPATSLDPPWIDA